MTAVLTAFIINYACYFSEIYRGGIESIAKGQDRSGSCARYDQKPNIFQSNSPSGYKAHSSL